MLRIVPIIVVPSLILAAACGGGAPAAPGTTPGGGTNTATIAGTAAIGTASKNMDAINGVPASGLTVTVSGTSLSTTTNATGYFQLDNVPAGTVRLQFRQSGVDAATDVANVTGQQLVTLEVQVSGTTAVIVSDARSDAKISLCHRTEGHGYHMITVSTDAESAHRGHGDAKTEERVPGTALQTFGENCQIVGPAVDIEKLTNGDDADSAPGPTVKIGDPVTWTYVVTNTGTIELTGISVTDDKGVAVSCPSTALPPSQSMTCTGSGVATLGQYRNVGTVTASSPAGSVTDTDASHYLGVQPTESTGTKVELCHQTGNGSYHLISVDVSAEPAHRAHGDAKVGEAVPGGSGTFAAGCVIR
jgi:hypothetical protein